MNINKKRDITAFFIKSIIIIALVGICFSFKAFSMPNENLASQPKPTTTPKLPTATPWITTYWDGRLEIISPNKTVYVEGEILDLTGFEANDLSGRSYSDGTERISRKYKLSNIVIDLESIPLTTNNKIVNVRGYSSIRGTTVSGTFKITVIPAIDTASDWAHAGITEACGKGFVPEEIQTYYQNPITRAEFCRMAVKWVEYATGKSIDTILSERGLSRDPNAFTDTSDPDILAAFALGITNGTGNKQFSPNGQFTREQAATMIMNTCKAIGINVSNPPSSDFDDMNEASSWARDGINFVRANGIMQGVGGGNFRPSYTYTRQESIVTFHNINHEVLLNK